MLPDFSQEEVGGSFCSDCLVAWDEVGATSVGVCNNEDGVETLTDRAFHNEVI